MTPLEKLVALYDQRPYPVWPTQPPTERSIAVINERFGCCLPSTFIEFARRSKQYGSSFVSLRDPDAEPSSPTFLAFIESWIES